MNQVPQHVSLRPEDLTTDAPIVVVCKMGGRSAQVTAVAATSRAIDATNLDGGMLAWATPVARWSATDGDAAAASPEHARRYMRGTAIDCPLRARCCPVRPRARRASCRRQRRRGRWSSRTAARRSTVAEHTLAAYVVGDRVRRRRPRVRRPADPRRPPRLRARPHRQPHLRRHAASVSELDLRRPARRWTSASWHVDLPDSADELLGDSPYLAGVAPDRGDDGGGC